MIENIEQRISALLKIGDLKYQYLISQDKREINVNDLFPKYGISIPSSNRIVGRFPLFASNGIIDYISIKNASNAIIFGCRGTLGNVFYSKEYCFVLNTALYIQSTCNYGNIYFGLRFQKGLTLYQSGAAQPQITIEAIKNAKINIPKDNSLNSILDLLEKYKLEVKNLKLLKETLLGKYF